MEGWNVEQPSLNKNVKKNVRMVLQYEYQRFISQFSTISHILCNRRSRTHRQSVRPSIPPSVHPVHPSVYPPLPFIHPSIPFVPYVLPVPSFLLQSISLPLHLSVNPVRNVLLSRPSNRPYVPAFCLSVRPIRPFSQLFSCLTESEGL